MKCYLYEQSIYSRKKLTPDVSSVLLSITIIFEHFLYVIYIMIKSMLNLVESLPPMSFKDYLHATRSLDTLKKKWNKYVILMRRAFNAASPQNIKHLCLKWIVCYVVLGNPNINYFMFKDFFQYCLSSRRSTTKFCQEQHYSKVFLSDVGPTNHSNRKV